MLLTKLINRAQYTAYEHLRRCHDAAVDTHASWYERSPTLPLFRNITQKMAATALFYILSNNHWVPSIHFTPYKLCGWKCGVKWHKAQHIRTNTILSALRQVCSLFQSKFPRGLPLFQHTFQLIHEPHHRWYFISLTAFSIWRGFCMSGRKLLDPTSRVQKFSAWPTF